MPSDPASRLPVAWRVLAVFGVGLGVGVATSYLQGALPTSANFVANSGAVWTVIAFLVSLWAATRTGAAVAAGLGSLLGEVLGYYAIASPIRHIATSARERALWIVAAVVIGSIAGWLAAVARRGRPGQQLAATGAVCGVVAGEGVYALWQLSRPAQGWVEIVIAVGALIAATAWLGRSWSSRACGLPAGVAVAAIVCAAYTTA